MALISVPDFSIMVALDRPVVNLQQSCSVSEHEGSLLLEKHHIIQLGCFNCYRPNIQLNMLHTRGFVENNLF